MVKTIEENSAYEPCVRSYKWLKLKRDYLEQSLSDSLDLVVIGAKYGEGKRTGFFGTLLFATFNQDAERYETTGMLASGFTDEDLKVLLEKLKPLVLKEPHSDVFVKEGTGNRKVISVLNLDGCMV
jgi:DNA ligase-1